VKPVRAVLWLARLVLGATGISLALGWIFWAVYHP
jgi:hypothetical protein